MNTGFSYSNVSDIDITFNICKKKENNDIINITKQNLPELKIFRINSLIFNNENEKQEILTKYDCIFSQKDNSLYLLFNESVNYLDFTKDKLINILDFSKAIEIDNVFILINKKNKQYIKIVKDMLIVGFELVKKFPLMTIDGYLYITLKMSIKDIKQEIIQIDLI